MIDFYLYWVADGRKMVGEYTLTYHRNSITLTYSSGFPLNYEALYNYGCTAVAFYRNTGRGGAC